jgi:integrase
MVEGNGGYNHNNTQIVLDGQAYRNFAEAIKSPRTLEIYNWCLKKFMEFVHVDNVERLLLLLSSSCSPSSLSTTSATSSIIDSKIIESYIIDFIITLRKQRNLSHSTLSLYAAAVISFYTLNDVILNRKKILRYLGQNDRKHKDRAYTNEEIHKLLDLSADLRLKVVILLLASTGMRLGAISTLKLSHLSKIEEYDIYKVVIYEGTKEEYVSFTTPECYHAIVTYLEYRQRCGEKLTSNAPLIRELFDPKDMFMIKNPRAIRRETFFMMLEKALIRSGLRVSEHLTEIKKVGYRKEVARANGFRKFVNTMMVKAKVNPVVKEMLLGHTTGLDDNYYRPSEDDLLQEYLKAVDLLTINNEHRLQRQVAELTNKTNDNEYIIRTKLEEKDNEIKLMKEQFTSMQSQVQSLVATLAAMDQPSKNELAKQMVQSGIYKKQVISSK